MDRRSFLEAVGVGSATLGGLGGLSGCVAPDAAGSSVRRPGLPAGSAATLPVPADDLRRGASRDGIPAITDPAFASDWAGVSIETRGPTGIPATIEPRLDSDQPVVGLVRDGTARAYSLQVLRYHEVVNDNLGGPLLVTYCPLCRSAVVARRRVRGLPTVFGVSGLLWHSDLVMYDRRTDSLWSQVAATAIRGPETGSRLEQVPSTTTTWGTWVGRHPETEVLLPAPRSTTVRGPVSPPYHVNPYAGEANSPGIGLGGNDLEDDRLDAKTVVVGVSHDGAARAYPRAAVAEADVVNDAVGDRPVVVTVDANGDLQAYDRRVDGQTLRFQPDGDAHLRAGASRWERATGTAVSGPFAGTTLARANDVSPLFWFAWSDFHPGTDVYDRP